jgi:hypothetical protein
MVIGLLVEDGRPETDLRHSWRCLDVWELLGYSVIGLWALGGRAAVIPIVVGTVVAGLCPVTEV